MTARSGAGSAVQGPVGVGLIGAGNISDEYLTGLRAALDVRVLGIADLDTGRAAAQAERHGVPFSGGVTELLSRADIELVVNLTIPAVHAEVSLQALGAGKHVWTEKPLALDRAAARRVLEAARDRSLLVGNAPDTVLGEGIQTSQALLDAGRIGAPQTLLTLMQGPGPDGWHPRPQFLFEPGAGPLFDIGPYYVTTMVQLLGPVVSVQALGHRARDERVIGSGPDAGTTFPVRVDTHLSVLTTFASGVVGTSIYSFDSPQRRQLFELTGDSGALRVPVSGFDGPTELLDGEDRTHSWTTEPARGRPRSRGAGVVDLARAIRTGDPVRCGGELAYHVLDVLVSIEESASAGGTPVAVTSTAGRPRPVPPEWDPRHATVTPEPSQTPEREADR
ncbi:oxidoreductase [Luteimicrobium album]|uniref:Oxidoreductase n=1 Tax=Luteimicrobium album TaxID=1054550 RepID=A0ABQ6HYN6_9MICO|nr:Gfo/Idh/MocA family oxidoreductase [Luteimicrobium album]GMA23517.1 oxidoreductase [Luteimicrobium album]